MAIVTIPRQNWPTHLAAMIGTAQDGDTIVVHDDAIRELGERAAARMRPKIELTFVVESKKPIIAELGFGSIL